MTGVRLLVGAWLAGNDSSGAIAHHLRQLSDTKVVLLNLSHMLRPAHRCHDRVVAAVGRKQNAQALCRKKMVKQAEAWPEIGVARHNIKEIGLILRGQLDQPRDDPDIRLLLFPEANAGSTCQAALVLALEVTHDWRDAIQLQSLHISSMPFFFLQVPSGVGREISHFYQRILIGRSKDLNQSPEIKPLQAIRSWQRCNAVIKIESVYNSSNALHSSNLMMTIYMVMTKELPPDQRPGGAAGTDPCRVKLHFRRASTKLASRLA
ncbi:hypothetical protein VB716_15210 [Synechococcus sp. CCY9201]|nr:hypothetical protein [Synechococcus sp. CCY9201]